MILCISPRKGVDRGYLIGYISRKYFTAYRRFNDVSYVEYLGGQRDYLCTRPLTLSTGWFTLTRIDGLKLMDVLQ